MAYKQQLEEIWGRLQDPDAPEPRHPIPTREAFEDVCAAFLQAEWGPECDVEGGGWGGAVRDGRAWRHSNLATDDIKTYRAEWNIWTYYYGKQVAFPGLDPAVTLSNFDSYNQLKPSDNNKQPYPVRYDNYAVENIGPELRRGRPFADEQARANAQKERASKAIERRAQEAKVFTETRRHKSEARRERKYGGSEWGRGGSGSARNRNENKELMEWYKRDNDRHGEFKESYVRGSDGYGNSAKGYCRKWDGYGETAENYSRFGDGHRRPVDSYVPRRDGYGYWNTGGKYGHREREGYADRFGELGRKDYNKRDDRQYDMGGPVQSPEGRDRRDGYGHDNNREARLGASRHPGIEEREGRSRKAFKIARRKRKQIPSPRREDNGLSVDYGVERTSQWVQDGQVQAQNDFQDEGIQAETDEQAETGLKGSRDRGFGIMNDASQYYKEERKRRREE